MKRFIFLILLAVVISSCAVPRFKQEVWVFENNHGRQKKNLEQIKIVDYQLPPGIELDRERGELRIDKAYQARYTIIGSAKSSHQYSEENHKLRQLFWYVPLHEQHSSWRNGFCAAQAPLRAITIGLWNLVPLSYPCFSKYPQEEAENIRLHQISLKKMAKKMGANLIIIDKLENKTDYQNLSRENLELEKTAGQSMTVYALYDRQGEKVVAKLK